MKKTVLSVLIVLLLSVVMIGCGGDPCEVCGEPSKDCICNAASESVIPSLVLTELGLAEGDVLAPLGTKYLGCEKSLDGKNIAIYWEGANQAMFDYYFDAWRSRSQESVVDFARDKFSTATIIYRDKEGVSSATTIEYPAGTIIFQGTKK